MSNDKAIEDLLQRVFEIARQRSEDESFEKHKSDFVFHMTDWTDDLEKLHGMFSFPARWDPDSASEFLIGFFYHVAPHLNAAAKLLIDTVSDPFSSHESGQNSSVENLRSEDHDVMGQDSQ